MLDIGPPKGPEGISLATYIIMLVLAAWGGVAHFMRRLRMDKNAKFSIIELVGEITISCFAGIMVLFICEAMQVDRLWTAALCGLSGHMSSRVLFKLDAALGKLLDKYIGRYTDTDSKE